MGNNNSNIDLEITDRKINNLEHELDTFMYNQTKNIETIFRDKNHKKQNIEYIIYSNNKIEIKSNDLISLDDYAIQWSIQGSNYANTTKCHLTLFNIGWFLGAHGFLYSTSLFYYYFMKIPTTNRQEEEIKKDIDDCLKYIDKGDIDKLNSKWDVHLNDIYLNDLKEAKNFLINLFHEKITDNIFQKLNNKIIKRIKNFCKTKISNFFTIIYYFLTVKLSKEIYIKQKNNINRNYLIQKILSNLKLETFENNNIFVIATDNDVDAWKNYGATFKGYYLEGLGEMDYARRLVENDYDGFIIGNNPNNQNKKLYNFYISRINNIKNFFLKNQKKIDNINNGLNIEVNIREIAEDLDLINKQSLDIYHEDIIDNEPYIQIKHEEKINEQVSECEISTNRETIVSEMGSERYMEYLRLERGLKKDNVEKVENAAIKTFRNNSSHINENEPLRINQNLANYNNNEKYLKDEKENANLALC